MEYCHDMLFGISRRLVDAAQDITRDNKIQNTTELDRGRGICRSASLPSTGFLWDIGAYTQMIIVELN